MTPKTKDFSLDLVAALEWGRYFYMFLQVTECVLLKIRFVFIEMPFRLAILRQCLN